MNKYLNELVDLFKNNDLKKIHHLANLNINNYSSDFTSLKLIGIASLKMKKYSDSIKFLQKSIEINKNDFENNLYLGIAFLNIKQYKLALNNINTYIDLNRNNKIAYNYLGIIYNSIDNFSESVKAFKQAVNLDSKFIEAIYNLGLTYNSNQEFFNSEECFLKVNSLKSNYQDTDLYLAIARRHLKKYDIALEAFYALLKKNIQKTVCLYNIGKIFHERNNYEKAIIFFNKAFLIDKNYEDLYNAKGLSLLEQEKFEDSKVIFNRAILLFPKSKIAYYNLGILNLRLKKFNIAIKFFDKSLKIDPNFADANFNKSFCLLIMGNFIEGWKYYKWRLEGKFLKESFISQFSKEKLKSIKDINGKKILVLNEQGLGDTIQFSRYLKMLIEKNACVIFLVQKSLKKLISTLSKKITIITKINSDISYDYYCNLIDLPGIFHTSINSIPHFISYISVDEKIISNWKIQLDKKKFNIGIAWQGSNNKIDKGRSFSLNLFKKISKIENINLISLQKNYGSEQIKEFKKNYKILDLSDILDQNNDFIDTAAIIKSLDLVITPCTSISHLAGALGCKVWLLLQFVPDWRWLYKGNKSNWYPSMKIYRQSKLGDWETVFSCIYKDLKKIL